MKKEKNETKIILIGIGIIIAVVVLMFLKTSIKENKIEEKNILENQEALEKIKSAKSISPDQLFQKIENNEKINLIDIRSASEFEKEHLLDSVNILPSKLKENIAKLNKTLTYVLIDNTDTIEVMDLVSSTFAEKEIVNTYYLKGGLNAWKKGLNPTISEGDPNSAVDQAKVNYIDSDELKSIIEKGGNILILDVRSKENFTTEKIPGSANIYFDDIERRVDEIPLGKRIIVYDDDSFSAFKAAVRLFDLGRINVLTLSDGFVTWKEKGYPTE